ncbi:helix-turn-helix domain-containing protein [Echinicola marina]|uniref:helix-turn-helix domain-containing protein n=1 Tax=Echinicola marina TaxID=2859768 RepID=UPI001CF6C13B|nr:hypothetical protein [Echinicola marina]UCS92372.1 helix-turn-helix domain-containing protein [Echinicola marina]
MQINISLSTLVQLMAATASLIAALVLTSYPSNIKDQKYAMRLLSLMFICLFCWIALDILSSIEKLNFSSSPIKLSFFSLVFMSFFVPLHYIHIIFLINKRLELLPILIHFAMPISIFTIGMINFNDPKIATLEATVMWLVYIQLLLYWFFELRTGLKILCLKKQKRLRIHKGWLKWVKFYIIILPFLFIPFFLFKVAGYSTQDAILIDIAESIVILSISLALFLRPDFLFGLIPLSFEQRKKTYLNPVINTNSRLNADQYKRLLEQITLYLDELKPHLEEHFSIEQMAKELKVSTKELENYFWEQEGLSFEEYINQQRIIYSQAIIQKGAISKLTLDILAKKSGFKNRIVFINCFKEFTGYNALDYISHFLKIPSNK